MSIQDTIREQVTTHPVVLYMKGTPDFPQCGFSSTVHVNQIARDAQAAKLRLVVETAIEVWGTAR